MHDLISTYRDTLPSETLNRLTPLLKEFGISRVADITELDILGIPSFAAYRPNSHSLSCSQGKGVNRELAKISAIMEAIEVFYLEQLPQGDLFGSYDELSTNYKLYPIHFIRKAIRNDYLNQRRLYWMKGNNLIDGSDVYFPRNLITLNLNQIDFESPIFWSSSNGLASGNTLSEALVHALCEVIERHVHETCQASIIDISSIEDVHCQSIILPILEYENLIIYEYDNPFNVPVFGVRLTDHAHHSSIIYEGWGCHLSSRVALLRAITEAAQSRLTYIAGARDDLRIKIYQKNLPKIEMNKKGGKIFKESNQLPESMDEVLGEIIKRFLLAGFDQLIYRCHCSASLPFSVVTTIVPGLLFDEANHFFPIKDVP